MKKRKKLDNYEIDQFKKSMFCFLYIDPNKQYELRKKYLALYLEKKRNIILKNKQIEINDYYNCCNECENSLELWEDKNFQKNMQNNEAIIKYSRFFNDNNLKEHHIYWIIHCIDKYLLINFKEYKNNVINRKEDFISLPNFENIDSIFYKKSFFYDYILKGYEEKLDDKQKEILNLILLNLDYREGFLLRVSKEKSQIIKILNNYTINKLWSNVSFIQEEFSNINQFKEFAIELFISKGEINE